MSVESLRAFQSALADGTIYVDVIPVKWSVHREGTQAVLPIEGTPDDVSARVIVFVGTGIDSWHVSIFWGRDRIFGFDNTGSPHLNQHDIPIRTPHRNFVRQNGYLDAEAVDTMSEGIVNCETALRYVLRWSELPSGHLWRDPFPVQLGTPVTPPAIHAKGGRR